jgi:hypothetical protein
MTNIAKVMTNLSTTEDTGDTEEKTFWYDLTSVSPVSTVVES